MKSHNAGETRRSGKLDEVRQRPTTSDKVKESQSGHKVKKRSDESPKSPVHYVPN
jgi:hypothetical protein